MSKPDHRHARADPTSAVEADVDELWSFVGNKASRQWVWITTDATIHQVIAFHVGERNAVGASFLPPRTIVARFQHL